jgi:hypothetical protein
MITLHRCLTVLIATMTAAWFHDAAPLQAADSGLGAVTINIDFNGAQNNQGPRGPGPTYVGQGAAGGGTVWNGVLVDSRLPDGLDDQNLTITSNNLTNSVGTVTPVSLTISPVGGDDPGAGTDPNASAALFGDYLFVGAGGQITGKANFTISGLGSAPFVELYLYYGSAGNFVIPDASPSAFPAKGIFAPNNTIYYAKVAVTDGAVNGTVGTGPTTLLYGMTIQQPLPAPFVKSAEPTGAAARYMNSIKVELEDYVTKVASNSVQLLVNGQAVPAAVSKPAGSSATAVTYAPSNGWVQGGTYNARIIFGDNASPSVVQTNDFSFTVLNEAQAAATVNIDFTGIQNNPGPRGPGPLYVGQGPAGGGTTWAEIVLNTQLPDGSDARDLTATGSNLTNSIGGTTTVGFSMGPVGADDWFGGTNPTASDALMGDYLFFVNSIMGVEKADFTISGLGDVPFVDLFFISGSHGTGARSFIVNGASSTRYIASGIFTPDNTLYFAKVAVTNGTATGSTGNPGLTVLDGLTIVKPLPQPFVKSAAPTGTQKAPSAITIELQDYTSQVVPSSVKLWLNGQSVAPVVAKPAGSSITTVTYVVGSFAQGSTNTYRLVFSDNAASPVTQTNDFSFVVFNEALAAVTVNIDFTGIQNDPGPRGPGPLYVGVGPAGGGTIWDQILLNTQLPDGSDDRSLTASGNNLTNSAGGSTTIGFSMGPVGADDWFGGTDPASTDALMGDYLFFINSVMGVEKADFTISGLGDAPYVDLYFISGSHGTGARSFIVDGATPATFTANGIFTPDNTLYFSKVPVNGGKVTGSTGNPGLTVLDGLTIQTPLRQPYVKSASPTGQSVPANVPINIQLQDYVTQVVPNSVHLLVNGQAVTPTVSKPSGSAVTTVTYLPAGNWLSASTNTYRLVFSDSATPPVLQTADFTFIVFNETLAQSTINIDFTGIQNDPGPRGPGPLYSGFGPAGGGTNWAEILLSTQLPDGTDARNLTASGTNLINSAGGATSVSFAIGPVGADDWFGGTDPSSPNALWGDYLFFVNSVMGVDKANFTISGLGSAPLVNLYFLSGSHGVTARNFIVDGASPTTFTATGIFTPDNTLYFANVPVNSGKVTGSTGNPGLTVLNGLTIQLVAAQAASLSIARQGNGLAVSWTGSGKLQSADQVSGNWTEVIGATSPFPVTPTGGQKFYRLQQTP